MSYLVVTMTDGGKVSDMFTDFRQALAHFKQLCEDGRMAAIYNMV